MKLTLIAKRSASAAIAFASVLGLLVGCALAWVVWSTHLPARYPQAASTPYVAVLAVYIVVIVLSVSRSAVPFAIRLSVSVVWALLTLLVASVLIEMILCHYDRYACINL